MKKSSTNPSYHYFSPEMKIRMGIGTYWKIYPIKGPFTQQRFTQQRSFHFKPSITFSPFQPLYFHFTIDPNFPLCRTTYLTTIEVVKHFKRGSFTYTLQKNFLNGHKILYKPMIIMPLHGERRWDAFLDTDSGVIGVQKTFLDYRLNYFKALRKKSSRNLNEKSSRNLNEKSSRNLNEKSSRNLNEKSSRNLNEKIESIPINKEVLLNLQSNTNNFMTFIILFILILRFFIMRFWNKKKKKMDINEIREKLKKYRNNDKNQENDNNNHHKIRKL